MARLDLSSAFSRALGWKASSTRQAGSLRRRVRPSLEVLEDRSVPAIFNVGAFDVASLIGDITIANGNGQSNVINLTKSSYLLKKVDNFWYGPNGLPPITSNLTIHGNGSIITRDANPADNTPDFRFFYVSGGLELQAGSLTMDNVTLQAGLAKGGDSNTGGGGLGAGGAIFNQGTLSLNSVTLEDNEALGGATGVTTAGVGGGGMGQDAPTAGVGGGFGGSVGTVGGSGGAGGADGGGGGGGFLTGAANGSPGPNVRGGVSGGAGGGQGGFAQGGHDGGIGGGSDSTLAGETSGAGGDFGSGGGDGPGTTDGGGGGGVGGGGGASAVWVGGSGGFGGGGGVGGATTTGGAGGFGAGAGTDNGVGGSGAGLGGAIFNMGAEAGGGIAKLVNCTLTNNSAAGGSFTGNGHSGFGLGGAVFNLDGSATLTNDTLDANSANDGGAVYNLAFGNDIRTGGTVTALLVLNNSILADSFHLLGLTHTASTDLVSNAVNDIDTAPGGSNNLVMRNSGPVSAGVITVTASPNLGPLQKNGGLTATMLPQAGSPALGAADPALAPGTDQRGLTRPPAGPTDIGSVQVTPAPPAPSSSSSSPSPAAPPALHTPSLLAFFDSLLGAIETVNGNETETVTDRIFGFPLIVSTYDGAGNLISVFLFGIDFTSLFESL